MARNGMEQIRIEKTGQVDCSSLLPLEVSGLPRGLHPTCVAFHPTRPLLAVGVATCVGGYDLVTGCRTGRVDVGAPAVEMVFSRDGSMLVVATQAWHLVGVNTATWRPRLLAPNHAGKTTPLEGILIAITSGPRQSVFFTRVGKLTVRMAVTAEQLGASDAGSKAPDKLKWGLKLKLADIKKPIVALAAHPSSPQLLVMLEDGNIRGYTLASTGVVPVFPPTYMLPMDTFLGRGPASSLVLQAAPHPFIPGGCLLLLGSGGGGVSVLELLGRDEPLLLLSGRTPDGARVIGMGLHEDTHTLLAFVATEGGSVRGVGWQLQSIQQAPSAPGAAQPTIRAVPVPVSLGSLETSPAVDVLMAQQLQQQKAAAGAAQPAGGTSASGGAASGSASAGKMGWQRLWGSSATPAAGFGSSYLLNKVLSPVVSRVVLHPTLGLLAVQRMPALALQTAPGIKDQAIGTITGEEAAIARRTSSINIMRVTSEAHPLSAWPGALATPLHTALDFWQSSTGMSPLAFPCHLYYLSKARICKYALATKQAGTLTTLAPSNPTTKLLHTERFMVYSVKQHAWLVFFETSSSAAKGKAEAGSSPAAAGATGAAAGPTGASPAAAGATGSTTAGGTGPAVPPAAAGGMSSVTGGASNFNAAIAAFVAASSTTGAAPAPVPSPAAAGPTGASSSGWQRGGAKESVRPPGVKWEFTLIRAGHVSKEQWFLPGKSGAFLGPDDGFFAILPPTGHRVSLYVTASFRGRGPPAYTIDLGRPASLLGGIFAGPAALGAPYVGAEAAAEAKRKEEEAAAKAENEAAEKAAAEADGTAAEGEPEEDPLAAAGDAPTLLPGGRLPRWMRNQDDDSSDDGGDFIPVVGIGPAFKGGNKGRPAGGDAYNAAMAAAVAGFSQPEAAAAADGEGAAAQGPTHFTGGGVLMWHAAGGKLVVAGLPPPGATYAAGDDSDDPDAAEDEAAEISRAPHEGTVVGEYSLQLLPGEHVLHVSWQNLANGPPLEPQRCAGAILTSHRLLLVTGDLGVVASVDARGGSAGVVHPITSLVWVGPALLYMTAAGQVMQLTWTGDTQQVASVASSPPALLLGALPDCLLLLRLNPATGQHQVATRAVSILQPLVLGWCSLAAAGLLPKGLIRSRAALQNILQTFDATHVTSGLLWALIAAWCWDVAAALSNHCVNVEPSVALAANAAAGQWQPVVSALLAEHQQSVYHPRPAPTGTALHHKLLAAAAGAICHGQFVSAAALLQAAGEWETAMAVAVCQGDFTTLREMSLGGVQAASATEASEVASLAGALVAAYERVGQMYSTNGANMYSTGAVNMYSTGGANMYGTGGANMYGTGGANMYGTGGAGMLSVGALGPQDWRLRCCMADHSFFSDAKNWSFGAAGALPQAETSGFNAPQGALQEGEVGPIPRSEVNTLGVYLGLSDLADISSRGRRSTDGQKPSGKGVNPAAAGVTGASDTSESGGFNLDVLLSGLASAPSLTASGLKRSDSLTSAQSSDTEGAGKAAAAGDKDPFAGLGFDDDDDEDSYSARKFKIVIKSKEETQSSDSTGAAAGPTGGDLKEAASKLKLGPLQPQGSGSGSGNFSSRLKGGKDEAAGGQPLPSPSKPPKGPQLGGPPMRPKSASNAAASAPSFTDDDFFAALAPVIPAAAKQQALRAAPPPPPAASSSSRAAPAPPTATRTAPQPPPAAAAAAERPAPPPPPAPAAAAAGSTGAPAAAAAAAAGGNPTQLYLQGVGAMEAGQWDTAAGAFSATLSALAAEPPSDSRTLRQQFAAQYLAVVLLLKATAAGSGAKEARLYRYAAALKLDDRHSMMLGQEAIRRNKERGNYRYTGDMLTSLVTKSLGHAPMELMAKMQEDIDACDRAGGRDAELSSDEDRESWVGLVTAAQSQQEVEEVVLPLIAA